MSLRRRLVPLLATVLVACGPGPFDDRAPPSSTGEITVPGAALPYEIYGTGRDTVLLVAGGPAFPGAVLRDVARFIGQRRTAILYDARGRGYARALDGDSVRPSIDRDLHDLDAIMEQLGLGRVSLVAQHYGALVATRYALAHPTRVARLALIGPMMPRSGYNFDLALVNRDTADQRKVSLLYASALAREPGPFCEATWGWMLAPAPEVDSLVVARLAPDVCAAPDRVLAGRGALKQAILTSLGAWDFRDSLPRLQLPVLVLQGDRNTVLNHSAANWAYRVPGGVLQLVHGSPFFPWLTDPAPTASALDAFLDGRTPDGSRRPARREVISPDDSLSQGSATNSPATP